MLRDYIILTWLAWIAIYDIKHYLIRNIDLLAVLLLLTPNIKFSYKYALLNISIYLTINLLVKGKIGAGDIKLSFICGLLISSYFQLFNALSVTWIIGGFYAIFVRQSAVAFAPFMIFGTYLARIF